MASQSQPESRSDAARPPLRCPICKSPVPSAASGNKGHPFCSERCQLVDLGHWLDESYRL